MQGHHATSQQKNRRNGAFEDGPEQPLGLGRIRVAAGRDDIDHHGARVRRGHKKENDHDHRQNGRHQAKRETLQEDKQGDRDVFLNRFGHAAGREPLDINGAVAENGHPGKGHQGRHDQHAGQIFAQGAPVGDAGDKHAHERTPGDPPRPVKNGPAVLPGAAFSIGLVPEAQIKKVLDVIAQVFDPPVEQKQGRTQKRNKDHQQQGQRNIDVTEQLNAALQAAHDRPGRQRRDAGDQYHLNAGVLRDTEQVCQAGVNLLHAEGQRGGDAVQAGDCGQNIDGVAQPAIDALF